MFRKFKIFFITLVVILLVSSFAYSEYYQYTDENGKLRFTDNITNVPKEQRKAVKKFKSEISSEIKITDADPQPKNSNSEVFSNTDKDKQVKGNTSNSIEVELSAMHKRLNETHAALENDRLSLEAHRPKKGDTNSERIEYSTKVEELNARIKAYENDLKVFNDKLEASNALNKKNKSSH